MLGKFTSEDIHQIISKKLNINYASLFETFKNDCANIDISKKIGTFDISKRAARAGRNPQTGKSIKIAASKAPKFKAGKALKDLVNKKK